jgi:hypothetical protein
MYQIAMVAALPVVVAVLRFSLRSDQAPGRLPPRIPQLGAFPSHSDLAILERLACALTRARRSPLTYLLG